MYGTCALPLEVYIYFEVYACHEGVTNVCHAHRRLDLWQ